MSGKRTMKQAMYYDEAIRLHFELGYGEYRIAAILPIGHTTAWRWIRRFAAENKDKTTAMARTKKTKTVPKVSDEEAKDDIQSLKADLSEPRQGLHPDGTQSVVGERHHLHHRQAFRDGLRLLLPLPGDGCLYRGDCRPERRGDA